MQHAILRDCDHPLLDSGAAKVVGEHDDPTDDPHSHYSILTIENGRVVDVDWGYHGEDEAREHLGRGSKVVVRLSSDEHGRR